MPIKFRCPHCSQFLGISRTSAGSVVDCPACGRTLRVPHLDGRVDPLPSPKLNLADESLLDALDQLGGLENAAASAKPYVMQPPAAAAPRIATAPQPIVVEALPPQPVPLPGMAAGVDPLAPLIASEPVVVRPAERLRGPSRRDLLVAVVTAGSVWPVAWWLGRSSRRDVGPGPAPDPVGSRSTPASIDGASEAASTTADIANSPQPALVGRITYVGADAEARPDAGARILAFPESRAGSSKLSVVGFRNGSAETDRQLAGESLRLLGGAFAVADAEGRYQLFLTSSGPYYLLMISRYQARDPGGALPSDLSKILVDYFDSPAPLIGQTQYSFTRFRYLGRESAPRDHVFQRS